MSGKVKERERRSMLQNGPQGSFESARLFDSTAMNVEYWYKIYPTNVRRQIEPVRWPSRLPGYQ